MDQLSKLYHHLIISIIFYRIYTTAYANNYIANMYRKPDGSTTNLIPEMVEIFNNYFTSIFTEEDLTTLPAFQLDISLPFLENIKITPLIVYNMLKIIPGKSPGPEGWPLILLKKKAAEISIPLFIIFNKPLHSGILPDDWKRAHVTPIHKKGDYKVAGNYHSISLTSPIAKKLESIVRDSVFDHMLMNQLFTPSQHGFVPGKSCTTQLLLVMDYWTRSLDIGYPVDVNYQDFRKTCDSVPHNHLFVKLEAYSISDDLLIWLQKFLTNRKQCVILNGYSSHWSTVTSRVPQGSVLGPLSLLFTIYINDLPSLVTSPLLMFADDTKIFRSIQNHTDSLQLQSDINKLFEWSRVWQLQFTVSKCYHLHLGELPYSKYNIAGQVIFSTDLVKDLGVFIDNELQFHHHSSVIAVKASHVLALKHKSFECVDAQMFVSLYKSFFVRPILEYGNIIWGPHFVLDQITIEKMQRRATKHVANLHDLPYVDRLKELNLPTLSYRRFRGDIIFLHRIINDGFT